MPDVNNIHVFKKGMCQAFKVSIPSGGQQLPINMLGVKLT
jgi:hypothetical protein